jgi:hypothetical protein
MREELSPRNEKLLWCVKDPDAYTFNLDAIRDPDVAYPNQTRRGRRRCNPLGKNPGDVWQIPKVTSRPWPLIARENRASSSDAARARGKGRARVLDPRRSDHRSLCRLRHHARGGCKQGPTRSWDEKDPDYVEIAIRRLEA